MGNAKSKTSIAIAVLLACWYWVSGITESRIAGDGAQTLQLALGLARQGLMTQDVVPPFRPSMYREPLPVWSTMVAIKTSDLVKGPADASAYFAGPRARLVKMQNFVWFALLSGGVFWACYLLTASVGASLVAAVVVNVQLPMTTALSLDNVLNEPSAAAFLVIASALLTRAAGNGRVRDAAAAGALFGLLALTKAVALYVAAGTVTVFACVLALRRRLPVEHRFRWQQLVALAVAFAVVVGPWLYRNYTLFGSLSVAERGGVVLAIRAVKNQMTAGEFKGTFYVWAPGRHMRAAMGALLGYSEADLQSGGRLQRLNRAATADFAARDLAAERRGDPDAAVAFYRRARAMRVRLQRDLTARGVADPSVVADQRLRNDALEMIKHSPGRHLLMTVPFLWRGALGPCMVLMLGLVFALRRHRTDVAVFVLPALGMIACYGLMTHFIPRYSVPTVPVAIVVAVALATWLWTAARDLRTARAAARDANAGTRFPRKAPKVVTGQT